VTAQPATSAAGPTAASPATAVADALRGLCGGAVHLPGDPGYDSARSPWNVAFDLRPAAVAYPCNAEEVAAVVRAAKASGLRVAAQGTGHNPGPLGALDDVVLVRTSGMRAVTVDPDAMVARAETGALWLEVVEALAPLGLYALHGSSPDVGVAGYSLGGGMGWMVREKGLQANNLTAIEIVTPDGELRRVDADDDPDLFWALRGGGGNFGIVTALEFRVFPIADVYAGWLVWEVDRAREVLSRWVEWAETAPDEVTTAFRILAFPPFEEVPEIFRGRTLVVLNGSVNADDATAEAVLAPLRELSPMMDTFERVPTAALIRLHMDPEEPTPAVSGTAILAEMPDEAIDTFLAMGPREGSAVLLAELRQIGGAAGRPHPDGGALSHVEGKFVLYNLALAPTPEDAARGRAETEAFATAMADWSNGRQYLNFAENATDAGSFWDEESYSRLQAVRRRIDPDGVMVSNHVVPVGPAIPAQRD
jgi:FAD/FMN-containing dehydrogenase